VARELVLGVETSCDETAVAVVGGGRHILANVVATQIDLHARFGGVVPEVASRKHVETILPVLQEALEQADITPGDLYGVAVTHGPGLVGGLLVGLTAAKALAFGADLPLIGVNHVEGHIHANILAHHHLKPPFICLTVSGGHTDLLFVEDYGQYRLLGRTRDDAAGEAFDKVAKFLGLGYPGGPLIDALAREGEVNIDFPRAMLNEPNYDFSFSGLKTAVINYIHNLKQRGEEVPLADIAASFQQAVIDVLVGKTIGAAKEYGVEKITLSGGVAANSGLRRAMDESWPEVYYPPLNLCTDNGAMIASAGYFRLRRGERSPWDLNVVPGLRLV
jgi:N6-L-threonylcarbamoyladenine synthase